MERGLATTLGSPLRNLGWIPSGPINLQITNIPSHLRDSRLLNSGNIFQFLWHIISETTVKFTAELAECWGHYKCSAEAQRASTVHQEAFDEEIHLIKWNSREKQMYQATLNHFNVGSANTIKHSTNNFSSLLTSYDSCFPVFNKWTVSPSSPRKKTKFKKGLVHLLHSIPLTELTFKYIYLWI